MLIMKFMLRFRVWGTAINFCFIRLR